MARFYFHIIDGETFRDEEGTDLPDIETAEIEASRVIAAHLKDHPRVPWEDGGIAINVDDERGLTLFSLTVTSRHSAACGSPSR